MEKRTLNINKQELDFATYRQAYLTPTESVFDKLLTNLDFF